MSTEDWMSLKAFLEKYPNMGPISSLRWLIRKHPNEKFISQKGARSTKISPSRFFAWMEAPIE